MPVRNGESGVTIFEVGDDENKKILKEIAIGGVSGWLTGFIGMKAGKVAATAIGGALIILQIANHKGYIKINWSRVNSDVEKVKNKIQEEATGKKADWTEKLEKKIEQKTSAVMDKQRRWYNKIVGREDDIVRDAALYTCSFVAGFAVGCVSGK